MKKLTLLFALIGFSGFAWSQNPHIVDLNNSPEAIMRPVAINEVQWTDGFWAERYEQTNEITLRKLWDLAADPEAGHVLENFRVAATGVGEPAGTFWQDGWMFKWIEAAASIYKKTNNPWIAERMDEAIELIAAAQEDDGYISTHMTATGRPRFTDPMHHEVYTMGHLLTTACVHKRMTGKTSLFEVAIRTADFLTETLGEKVSPSYAHNPSAIMGLVEMYRETGEKKYLNSAQLIVDSRGTQPKEGSLWQRGPGMLGTDHIQDRTPLRESEEVVGHNVFFTYLFAGATDVYLETGDETLIPALERLWDDLTYKKMTINGGVSPVGTGLSPNRDIVNEGVGASYNLPVADAYNETCGQVGNFMWNYRLLAASGDAKYADIMELELYNGFLGGIGLDGESWFYRNALRLNTDFEELEAGHNFEAERSLPGRGRICCPTNLLRTFAQLQTYIYSVDKEGLWIHHYGGNTYKGKFAEGQEIQITQITDYPWEGKIKIKIDELSSGKEFAVRLRIPGWAESAVGKVNGKTVDGKLEAGKYLTIKRKWNVNDVIELDLPMPTRLMVANPKAEQLRNQVAVMRGPVLYCLESIDLPENKNINNVRIPSKLKLKPSKSDFPFGIKTLEGKAFYYDEQPWEGALYRPLETSEKMKKISISMIPYFAWNNRGIAAMSVWLPLEVK